MYLSHTHYIYIIFPQFLVVRKLVLERYLNPRAKSFLFFLPSPFHHNHILWEKIWSFTLFFTLVLWVLFGPLGTIGVCPISVGKAWRCNLACLQDLEASWRQDSDKSIGGLKYIGPLGSLGLKGRCVYILVFQLIH